MTDLAIPETAPVTLFRTDEPGEIVARATEAADALAAVIRKQKLAVSISGREYVKVEGWTLLGTMLGVFPVCVWTRPTGFAGEGPTTSVTIGIPGWEARVEARTRSGDMVGAAEAECLRSEKLWANRDDYALRSMAQTRATSKALRLPLGFVMTLAGFEATPAEEMPLEDQRRVQEGNTAGSALPDCEPAPAAEKATAAQAKKAYTVLGIAEKVAGLIPAEYAERLRAKYGTSHFSELSKAQASEVIDELKAMERDAEIPF